MARFRIYYDYDFPQTVSGRFLMADRVYSSTAGCVRWRTSRLHCLLACARGLGLIRWWVVFIVVIQLDSLSGAPQRAEEK